MQRVLPLVALVVVVCVAAVGVSGHVAPSSVAALMVLPGDRHDGPDSGHKVSAKLSTGHSASCTFRYRTLTPEEAMKAAAAATAAPPTPPPTSAASTAPASVAIDFRTVVQGLTGHCVSRKIEYWDYEVCIGRAVTQTHGGDVYTLGRTP